MHQQVQTKPLWAKETKQRGSVCVFVCVCGVGGWGGGELLHNPGLEPATNLSMQSSVSTSRPPITITALQE